MQKFHFSTQKRRLFVLLALLIALFGLMIYVFVQNSQNEEEPIQPTASSSNTKSANAPELSTQVVVDGLSHPWDIAFLPDQSMLFNERNGRVSMFEDGARETVATIPNVYNVGEGGLTGLTLDADFRQNRFVYTCFNSNVNSTLDVRLVRWKLNEEKSELTDRKDIITGIPSNVSGRHSGCRVRAANDGTLWVGTGDAAIALNPQDPKSLGGKILHVNRDGSAASGNLSGPFDARIFSYGHRNVQGIVLFDSPKNGTFGYSIEHGSDRDDEINLLKKGNFGWAPQITYVEDGVPMTDLKRFPNAISAIWSSGSPTIAPSGGDLLQGDQWGAWNGAIAMAVLKDQHVRIMKFNDKNKLTLESPVLDQFGRIRSATQGPDGNLYISTDNGIDDKIVKIVPSEN